MTVKEFQSYLVSLGYDTGGIDGIWGSKTAAAVQDFIKNKCENVEIAVESSNFWEGLKYFKRAEMACPCGKCGGFPAEPAETLMRTADAIRAALGVPMIVSSGVRCADHNTKVGGVANSRHLTGHAMDFKAVGKTATEVMAEVEKHSEIKYCYAINETYVHMDIGGENES